MKVLFLSNYFPKLPYFNNMGPWALDQAKAIAKNNEVLVISFTPWIPRVASFNEKLRKLSYIPKKYEYNQKLKIVYPKINPFIFKKFKSWSFQYPELLGDILFMKINKYIKEFIPDVVIANHVLIEGVVANKVKKEFKVNYICFEHSPDDFIPRNKKHYSIYKKIVENSNMFVNVSQYSFDKINEEYNFDKNLNEVLYNYSQDAAGYKDFNKVKDFQFYKKNRKYIVEVGNFEQRKNHITLLKIFNDIKEKYAQWDLVLIGGSSHTLNELNEYIQKNQLEGRVFILNDLQHEQVLNILNYMHIFCLPSFSEMFSVSALEALSASLPVIVTMNNGLTDEKFKNSSIINVDPERIEYIQDKLEDLMSNTDLSSEIGILNRRMYEGFFCSETYADNINKILKKSIIKVAKSEF